MSRADYLKERGWRLTREGWQKRGWALPPDAAVCAEQHFAGRPFPQREIVTPAQLASVRSAIEAMREPGRLNQIHCGIHARKRKQPRLQFPGYRARISQQ